MVSEIILIFGKRGSGKTTLTQSLIQDEARLIIFDPLHEYNAFGKTFIDNDDLISYLKDKSDTFFRITYQPDLPSENFDFICEVVYCLYDVVFVCEEVDIGTRGLTGFTPPPLERLICQGRHKNISIIAITRRSPEIPKMLTSQASKIISFCQHEPNDIEYLTKATNKDFADRLKGLKDYQYLVYDFKTNKIYETL